AIPASETRITYEASLWRFRNAVQSGDNRDRVTNVPRGCSVGIRGMGRRGMRALLLGPLLVIGLLSKATAQLAARPIPVASSVNGIPVTLSATYRITANPIGNDVAVDARIFADLIDVQKKLPDIMDSFKRGSGTCSRSAEVSFKDG